MSKAYVLGAHFHLQLCKVLLGPWCHRHQLLVAGEQVLLGETECARRSGWRSTYCWVWGCVTLQRNEACFSPPGTTSPTLRLIQEVVPENVSFHPDGVTYLPVLDSQKTTSGHEDAPPPGSHTWNSFSHAASSGGQVTKLSLMERAFLRLNFSSSPADNR